MANSYSWLFCIDERMQEGMVEMGFQPNEDADLLFPKDVKMTVSDFMSGIVFDDDSHDVDDDQTSNNNNNSNYNTSRKRTKEFFRKYIDDVYNGKRVRCHCKPFFFRCTPLVLNWLNIFTTVLCITVSVKV